MDTSTATITTIGIIALAAGFYRLLLRSSKDEPVNPTRIEFDSPVANERIQWAMTSTLSEAVTLPAETVEDHQDYHQDGLDDYGSPVLDERIIGEAWANFKNGIGPVKEGVGTILARNADLNVWYPICYRPGHDALGFIQAWLYQSNGPGGKFCWHIAFEEVKRGRPITITSWGSICAIDEIEESVA